MILYGVFKKADVKLDYYPHFYTKKIFAKAVDKYIDEYVREGIAFGELDHPPESSSGYNVINAAGISHRVLEVHWEENILYGTIELLDTPAGRTAKELFKTGVPLGISSRGVGSVKKNGKVKKDYELICFDIVFHEHHLLKEV